METKKAGELQDEKYHLVTDTLMLESIMNHSGIENEYKRDITGAIITMDNSGTEYDEIWFTESGRAFAVEANYRPAAYYIN